MKKRLLAMVLAALTLLSLAACGNSETTDYSDIPDFVVPSAPNPDKWKFDEPVTVTYSKVLNIDEAAGLPAGQTSADNVVSQYIKEKYNIELVEDWTAGEIDYDNQLSMRISSGNLPDIFYVRDYGIYKQLIDNDMVLPLNEAFTNQCSQYMLDVNAATHDGNMLMDAVIDGKLWGIPAGNDPDQFDILWIRKDWLNNLGLAEPTTIEELEEVLRAFTEDDPDGDGKNNTYGLTVNATTIVTPQGVNYGLKPIFNSMDAYPDTWLLDESGHIYNGSTDEKMKDALTVLQRWYKNGYIDPEFVSRTGEGMVEGFITSNQVGAFFGQWWAMPRDQGVLTQEWTAIACPLNANGKFSYVRSNPWSDCFMVSKDCENPEAAVAALAISLDIGPTGDREAYARVEEVTGGGTNRNLFMYGVWTTGADSMLKITEAIQSMIETGTYEPWEGMADYEESEIQNGYDYYNGIEPDPNKAWSYYGRAVAYPVLKQSGLGEGVTAAWYTTTESSAAVNALISKNFDQILLQIITGQKDVSAYDDFISQWHSLGGDTLISEVEAELGIE